MGLDGFSMANLGLHKDVTSAEMANQVEQLANKGLEFKIKDIDNLVEKKGIERKEEGSGGNNQTFDDGLFQKKEEDEYEDELSSAEMQLIEQELEQKDPREFSVRINPKTEMVELYNNRSKKIIETINAEDLMGLVSKLDDATGVLVNKKI